MKKTEDSSILAGIGIDIIEVSRVKRQLQKDDNWATGIFTEKEVTYCQSKRSPAQFFAARFAAKEAFIKALGSQNQQGVIFRDIEVINDHLGRPSLVVHGRAGREAAARGITNIQVSLSHIRDYAAALVTLETKKG